MSPSLPPLAHRGSDATRGEPEKAIGLHLLQGFLHLQQEPRCRPCHTLAPLRE